MSGSFVGTLTQSDWNRWYGSNWSVVDGGVTIRQTFGVGVSVYAPYSTLESAVDITTDETDRLVVLDQEGTVRRFDGVVGGTDPLSNAVSTQVDFGGAVPRALCVLSGRAYLTGVSSTDGTENPTPVLIAVPLARRILESDEQIRELSADSLSAPIDIAPDRRTNCLYVLDRGETTGSGSVSRVDPSGRSERVVEDLIRPTALAISSDGVLVIVDRQTTDAEGTVGRVFEIDLAGPERFGSVRDRGAFTVTDATVTDLAIASGADRNHQRTVTVTMLTSSIDDGDGTNSFHRRTLVLSGEDEQESLTLGAPTESDQLPVSEPATAVLVLGTSPPEPTGYVLLTESGTVEYVATSGRYERHPSTGRHEARLCRQFDSGELGTQWHYLTLDSDTVAVDATAADPSVRVEVRYYATDEAEPVEALAGIGSKYGSRLRANGVHLISQLAELDPAKVRTLVGQTPGSNPADWVEAAKQRAVGWRTASSANSRDVLLDVEGRYLAVELRLFGTATVSPRITRLQATFPREERSYVEYLPAMYRAEAFDGELPFLTRFLALFDRGFAEIDDELAEMTRLLDPVGVPSDYLPWLGRWVGTPTDEAWPERVRRGVVARAPELFRTRGTPDGLLSLLDLYLGDEDGSEDEFRAEVGATGDARIRQDVLDAATRVSRSRWLWEHPDFDSIDCPDARDSYTRLVNSPFAFLVLVGPGVSRSERADISRLVEQETPVHATARVVGLPPYIRLGGHAYLGINTSLPDRTFVLGEGALGVDTVLAQHGSGP